MSETPFRRTRKPLPATTTAEAAVANIAADAPIEATQRQKVERKPFGVPLSAQERAMLGAVAEAADKTPRSFSTRLLVRAMELYAQQGQSFFED